MGVYLNSKKPFGLFFDEAVSTYFIDKSEMLKELIPLVANSEDILEQGKTNKGKENKEETMLLDWLDCKSFTTLFVDGNHENFDRLYDYPVENWHGGKVHKIRPSVIHLMRGQVFDIDDRSIFTFGGASSHDIDGGILEPDDPDYKKKKKELDQGWLP